MVSFSLASYRWSIIKALKLMIRAISMAIVVVLLNISDITITVWPYYLRCA